VIEDSPNGIKAGKSAGMYVIALRTPPFKDEDLKEADEIIDKLSDIKI
jgi:beta-phosphoglucomutase-like phosphatase (HAD superfamily)